MHLALLAGVVFFAHHRVVFLGLFLVFLGVSQAYEQHQGPLILKEALLVGFSRPGWAVVGGLQRWWLQPIVSSLGPLSLFAGALGLTAVTDNAALTYLGIVIAGTPDVSKFMLVAGAAAGGGLTVIANAPNPAGVALLRRGFAGESVGATGLLLGALGPTAVAAAAFLLALSSFFSQEPATFIGASGPSRRLGAVGVGVGADRLDAISIVRRWPAMVTSSTGCIMRPFDPEPRGAARISPVT